VQPNGRIRRHGLAPLERLPSQSAAFRTDDATASGVAVDVAGAFAQGTGFGSRWALGLKRDGLFKPAEVRDLHADESTFPANQWASVLVLKLAV
jgi:hypothetical protein